MSASKRQIDAWLLTATNDEVLELARKARVTIARRIDAADARGDGPLVNALVAAARSVFAPGLAW